MTADSPNVGPVLVVDNHDSFVHTLVGYLHELGATTVMVEADQITADAVPRLVGDHAGILVSPGPGRPADTAASQQLVREAVEQDVPVLGVCLGHQVIAEALGARVTVAPELFHGVTSPVTHDGSMLFSGIPSPFIANRYHSLSVDPDTMPEGLVITARTDSGIVMGIAHRDAPLWGVQFHPESVLTEGGYRLLANWLEQVGYPDAVERSGVLRPHVAAGV
ncbi:gamma-glutamyl-gamma-aminobutyrate hydrolase family protein [Microbacterium sp. NPDC076895]|uniref:anthranilate synthase component II n=1 Tax=Microbacterium sp. NPDC076895 TaxID=3154957 RepID=UPI0034438BE9